MLMSECVTRLQADLAAIAQLGDPATAEAGERIAAALEGALRTRLLDLLGEAAVELDAQVSDGAVELRLVGGEPQLVYTPRVGAAPAAAEADDDGSSLNTWLVRAVSSAVGDRGEQRRGRPGGRLQGWAES